MKAFIEKYKSIILYLVFGALTTAVNIGVFTFLDLYMHWNYQVGTAIAWIASVLVAFFTNKVWVFSSNYSTWRAFWRELGSFFFFRLLTYFMEVVIMWVGVSLLRENAILMKLVDNIVVVIVNYVFSKWIIFRKQGTKKD
ncbi:Teichoic acid glycosylation protein [Pediococcus damnosus]|uniref:Teichoic acid glycosylation protein n=1 Tax=Pediococcus damnosus TaxID=51663 RepID=A0A0R2HCX0_9LACO|nr:GtrA family protein [Pediococcus damnosus]AMV61275.1 Teichoic acid glycosylation protein [Pediococcus damnosus]AMV62365.1 Teichoic acid glycosylation protein [Pediococcus damnosus]AMV65636.1 Teichoic acid glycosylation protein [Pediococcus damnosus]AMV67775.1 Teichoic acid glycosylation protein [Pediococcus damnosus]AMV68592.1 Teichoic acid glycosylation protein [Pediococcus damnosus]